MWTKMNSLLVGSLLVFQCYLILSDAKSHMYHSNNWLQRKLESIFTRAGERDTINKLNIKQISGSNSQDDNVNHIEDANRPDDMQRRCNDWFCADMKAFNITIPTPPILVQTVPTTSLEEQTPAIPNLSFEDKASTSTTEAITTTPLLQTTPFTPPIPPHIVMVRPTTTTAGTIESQKTSDSSLKTNWVLPSLNILKNGYQKHPGHLWPWNRPEYQDQLKSNGLRPGKPSVSLNKLKILNKPSLLNRINIAEGLPWKLKIEVYILLKRRGLIQ